MHNGKYITFGNDQIIVDSIDGHAWLLKAEPPYDQNGKYIHSLVEFNGNLYGGSSSLGMLYMWNGTTWVYKANGYSAGIDYIYDLTVFNNKLYTGGGSVAIFEFTTNSFTQRTFYPWTYGNILSSCVFINKMYCGEDTGELLEWDGTNHPTKVAYQLNSETAIKCLCVFNCELYGGTSPNGNLFEFGGAAWEQKAAKLNSETSINCLCEYDGNLYAGTSPNGNLFMWDSLNSQWIQKAGKLNSETSILSLYVFNGKLYGGTSPNGNLFQWNNSNAWVSVAPIYGSLTNISALIKYGNYLYGGAGSSSWHTSDLLQWNSTLE